MTPSSSPQSRRENAPHHRNTGCMAGIFHFISKYHSRRQRCITSGKKQEINKQTKNSCKRKCRLNIKDEKNDNSIHKVAKPDTETRLLSSEVSVRSPALPPGIRKLSPLENVISPPLVAAEAEAEVKRRKLIAALEKCDEDLKAISSIINALRPYDQRPSSSPDPVISVLRHFNNSHSLGIDVMSSKVANARAIGNGGLVQQKKPQAKDLFEKVISRDLSARMGKKSQWSSKAKIDSIDEACNDLVWGIERELGKIGLVLEDHIFRFLIDEFVKELVSDLVYLLPTSYRTIRRPRKAGASCTELAFVLPPLPLEACKRRLSF